MKPIPEHLRWWLLAFLGAGVTGDAWLRVMPWGFNLTGWMLLLAAAALLLIAKEKQAGCRLSGLWLLIAALFATAFSWRDSATLRPLNFMAMLGALGLAFWHAGAEKFNRGGVFVTLLHSASGLVIPWFGPFGVIARWLLPNATFSRLRNAGALSKAARLTVGLILSLPVVILFGTLFASADTVFQELVRSLTNFNLKEIFAHALGTVFFAALGAGILFWLWPREERITLAEFPKPSLLGTIELGTVLASLNLLFFTFIIIQVRYLFGGDTHVQQTAGLTYAEYARSGFFELLTVAALVIPLLLLCDWLWKTSENPRRFRQLATCLLVQLGVVMASAFKRLSLYLDAYGLTEQRLYAATILIWLGLVAFWLGLTVLRGRRPQFAMGAIMAAASLLLILNVINPDALIVRHQLARKAAGQHYDFAYLTRLSADAAPELLRHKDQFEEWQRNLVGNALADRWIKATDDWRRSNWSQMRARQLMEENPAIVSNLRQVEGIQQSPDESLFSLRR